LLLFRTAVTKRASDDENETKLDATQWNLTPKRSYTGTQRAQHLVGVDRVGVD